MAGGNPPSWHELSHFLASPPPPPPPYLGALPRPPSSLSALSFDTSSDLLFTATSSGAVQSWYGPSLARYTAWKANVSLTSPLYHDNEEQRRLRVSWKKAQPLPPPQLSGPAPPGTVAGGNGIREVYNEGGNVFSISPFGLHCANRRGLATWTKDVAAMGHSSLSLSSISPSPVVSSSDVVVCGSSPSPSDQQVISLNRHVGAVVRKVAAGGPLLQVRRSQRYLLTSTPGGHIQLRDPRSLETEHKLHAHPGGVIDMKAHGSLVWSVGWTMRLGHPVPEPLIKVHDLRNLRALVPVPFAAPGGPALLDIHPRISSTVVVAAPQGSWQVVDMNNPGEAAFFQLNTNSMITSLSFSPSAEYIAFGESDGSVRLWASAEAMSALNHPESAANAPRFNPFATEPPEVADPPERLPRIDWTADTPLSTIGMPYYEDTLSSVFPFDRYVAESSPLFNPMPKVDPTMFHSVRQIDGLHFAPLPRQLRGKRNVVKVTGRGLPSAPGRGGARSGAGAGSAGGSSKTLFRSEKEKERIKKTRAAALSGEDVGGESTSDDGGDEEDDGGSLNGDAGAGPPGYWRKKNILYSKFGVEDFDFDVYNRTKHSGLETHIPNCYLNSLLQCFFHLDPLRKLAEIHTMSGGSGRCEREDCLLCEAGFLFKMLEDAAGANCQATNFLRSFAKSHRAVSLALIDDEGRPKADAAYANLVQHANRFLLDTLASSWAEMAVRAWAHEAQIGAPRKEMLENVFAPTVKVKNRCFICHHEVVRDYKGLVVDLIYPRKSLSNEPTAPSDFASVLAASLTRESSAKGSCRGCGSHAASIQTRRTLPPTSHLPPVLSINANILTAEQMGIWVDKPPPPTSAAAASAAAASPSSSSRRGASHPGRSSRSRYLPSRISIVSGGRDGEKAVVRDLADGERATEGAAIYRLKSMTMQVQAPKDPAHLVSVVRKGDNGESEWFLFNDFLVRPVPESEALGFPASMWKIPAVVYFERIDHQPVDIGSIPWQVDKEILTQDLCITERRDPELVRHSPLTPDCLPSAGDLVAIDAEFIALNPEELEISSNGTRSLVRPSTMSLARVSVLHGQGDAEGQTFIDDHIATTAKVFDYLTQFSGIVDGDLDPARSKHTVVPQKLAYKKLRLLVDMGCIFIGHGLKKDFRIINIHVPPRQVIDTVDLFSSTSQARKLSLRFLSWFLLKEAIQADRTGEEEALVSGHDSIEDARAALHLFRIYETFKMSGRLEDVMEDLYEEGKRLNWRPPANAGQQQQQGASAAVAAAAGAAASAVGAPS